MLIKIPLLRLINNSKRKVKMKKIILILVVSMLVNFPILNSAQAGSRCKGEEVMYKGVLRDAKRIFSRCDGDINRKCGKKVTRVICQFSEVMKTATLSNCATPSVVRLNKKLVKIIFSNKDYMDELYDEGYYRLKNVSSRKRK